MNSKISLIFLFLAGIFSSSLQTPARAQDLVQAKNLITKLSSVDLWGRGYTRDGMRKAADFIQTELKNYGVAPLDGKNFFQHFTYPVNTFPGTMTVKLNGRELKPGEDYIVSEDSPSIKDSAALTTRDHIHFANQSGNVKVTFEDKLTWSVASRVSRFTEIKVDRKKFTEEPKNYSIDIQNRFLNAFPSQNICGIVRGTQHPESFIVMTAHYDHLGGMGENAYFPGANDNGSGVAFLLEMAQYYASHPQPYSMVFLFFGGEEAGLLGSAYFTSHPLLNLSRIRFLTNFDMVGTGADGATIVNATILPAAFKIVQDLNASHHYFTQITARGEASISDHFWFTENGVPAFFLYTWGGPPFYHDVFDRVETLPLTKFSELFQMFLQFNEKIMASAAL